MAYNFIKKETPVQVFSNDFCKIFNNTYFQEKLQAVLLTFYLSTYGFVCAFSLYIYNSFHAITDNSGTNFKSNYQK